MVDKENLLQAMKESNKWWNQEFNLELYKEILIDLRTEGTQEGYLKFFYNIENSLALLRIKKFRLTAKTNTQTLEGSFSISQLSLSE